MLPNIYNLFSIVTALATEEQNCDYIRFPIKPFKRQSQLQALQQMTFFPKKISSGISCESSANHTIHMKFDMFSLKNEKKSECRLL